MDQTMKSRDFTSRVIWNGEDQLELVIPSDILPYATFGAHTQSRHVTLPFWVLQEIAKFWQQLAPRYDIDE